MNRYHIKVFTKTEHLKAIKQLTNDLNSKKWQYTEHCIDNIKYRAIDLNQLLLYIRDLKLDYNQVFEYYIEDNNIIKICYRIPYNKMLDIILVLGINKQIITIYLNSTDDLHYTLKENLYCRA